MGCQRTIQGQHNRYAILRIPIKGHIKGKIMEPRSTAATQIANMLAEENAARTKRLEAGLPALRRLVEVALRDTGQSEVCGRFLLGLYNGPLYSFDLTEVRRLDSDLLEDLLAVLRMDASPIKEIHELVENGEAIFHNLRMSWATENEVATWPQNEQTKWQRLRG